MKNSTTTNIVVYSVIHAIIDALSAMVMLHGITSNFRMIECLIIYNALAFGLQLPLGILSDYVKRPQIFAIAGCSLVLLSVFSTSYSFIAIILVGFGNALFHIGGGSICLVHSKERATITGIFVAPGGIGLGLGTLLAKYNIYNELALIAVVSISILLILFLGKLKTSYPKSENKSDGFIILGILLSLIFVVILRSFIGIGINFSWKTGILFVAVLALSVGLGKAFGGILADKFGWFKVSVFGLLVSAPLLAFGNDIIIASIIGIFVFNFSMAVALILISNTLKGRPGLAFGLNAFCLLVGVLPFLIHVQFTIPNPYIIFILITLSASFLALALKLNSKSAKQQ